MLNPDKDSTFPFKPKNISKDLSFNPQVSSPAFVTEDDEDVIHIREVPMEAYFYEGEDEIITIKERSPEESEGDQEQDATETIILKEEDGLLDPEKLRREAEEGPGA